MWFKRPSSNELNFKWSQTASDTRNLEKKTYFGGGWKSHFHTRLQMIPPNKFFKDSDLCVVKNKQACKENTQHTMNEN